MSKYILTVFCWERLIKTPRHRRSAEYIGVSVSLQTLDTTSGKHYNTAVCISL